MSKEEILSECDNLEGYLYAADVSDAMDIHAEKVAVAFAEWLNQWYDLKTEMAMNRVYTHSHLYQYFINNVYNQ